MHFQENDGSSRTKTFQNEDEDVDETRIQRSEVTTTLRKDSKDDQPLKELNLSMVRSPLSPLSAQENTSYTAFNTVEEIIEGMSSSEDHLIFAAVQSARKKLSSEINPPIDMMIENGIVSRCVEFLSHFYNPSLQFESAWILTNVASGTPEQTNAVIEEGAVPKLVNLLSSPEMQVVEEAVGALGNIACDGPKSRDLLLSFDVMSALLDLIKPDMNITFLRKIVWCISSLCLIENHPQPIDKIKICLPVLARFLNHYDTVVLADTCMALSHLTEGTKDEIQCVLDTGVVPKLVELLKSSCQSVLTPALRTVGNIVTGSDTQTDVVIQAGVLQNLHALLWHQNCLVKKEAAWTVSNIAAGNINQIQAILDSGIVEPLIRVLACGDFESQREAAWAITNIARGGSLEQFIALIELEVLETFCSLLDSDNYEFVLVILDGINYFLNSAEKMGETERVAIVIEYCGGLDKLENLQNHENETVYHKTQAIILSFFYEEDLQNRSSSKRCSA